jgi:hypothetical protein
MVGQENDFDGDRIAQVYVPVRMWILVRADRTGKQLHPCEFVSTLGTNV